MNFLEILEYILMLTAYMIEYWVLFRNWFRFDKRIGMIFIALAGIAEDCLVDFSGLSAIGLISVHYIFFGINLIPFKKKMIGNLLIVRMIYLFLYNVIGTAAMVLCTTGYGLFMGTSNETWMTWPSRTPVDYVFRYITLIPVALFSAWIARRGSPLVEKLTRNERILLILGTVVPNYIFYAFKLLVAEDSSDYYGGIIVIFYGILMVVVGLCIVIFIEMALIRIGAERKEMKIRMELQNSQYEEICRLQDGVRELRHDFVNHMEAGVLSLDEVAKRIAECMDTVKEMNTDDR